MRGIVNVAEDAVALPPAPLPSCGLVDAGAYAETSAVGPARSASRSTAVL
jgi:hypothetical protein